MRSSVLGALVVGLLSGCGAADEGRAAPAGDQSNELEESVSFPFAFAFDPELSLTVEQHEEMRSCIVSELGAPIESETDGDRAWRASVVCAIRLGHEDVYWPDADADAREMLQRLTVDGSPSFFEQLVSVF